MKYRIAAWLIATALSAGSVALLLAGPGQGPKPRSVPRPLNLAALNTAADEDDPYVSRDGTRLLYASSASGHFTLMVSELKTRVEFFPGSERWPAGKEIEGPNVNTDNGSPYLTADGHDLYYAERTEVKGAAGERSPPANFEIVHAVRSDLRNPRQFTGPTFVQATCTEAEEKHPWLNEEGTELHFSRKTRDGWRIYVCSRPLGVRGQARGAFGPPRELMELPKDFHHACLSRDGRVMYLQGPVGKGRWGIFRATRSGSKPPWSKPVLLENLGHAEAPTGDQSPCLSRDGSRLYFASDRPGGKGGLDLWVVQTRWFKR
jgi:hypothetical protein